MKAAAGVALLHLVVGLPGAGKTRLARALERDQSALLLSPDDLQLALFGDDFGQPDHPSRHDAVEAALWPLALQGLQAAATAISPQNPPAPAPDRG